MKSPDLTLRNLMTADFLYFSWLNLKSRNMIVFKASKKTHKEFISKYWFEKASSLITKGTYNYKIDCNQVYNNSSFFHKKSFLMKLKNKVIENALLLIFKSHISRNSHFKNIALTECLRL